ncbi:MAG TPA: hypothetical protein VE621_06625 [Bryobacteraceae bacterium]|nr:hypothetical protein [Bryobacteraceae bacterium]
MLGVLPNSEVDTVVKGIAPVSNKEIWLFGSICGRVGSEDVFARLARFQCIPTKPGSALRGALWKFGGSGFLQGSLPVRGGHDVVDVKAVADAVAAIIVDTSVYTYRGRRRRRLNYDDFLPIEVEAFDLGATTVSFTSKEVGYVATRGGHLLRTDDGGRSWVKVELRGLFDSAAG